LVEYSTYRILCSNNNEINYIRRLGAVACRRE